jgi:LPXTG-motif cell wall-anchored protein
MTETVIWIVGAGGIVAAFGAYLIYRRRRARQLKAEGDWDKLYPLW